LKKVEGGRRSLKGVEESLAFVITNWNLEPGTWNLEP